MKRITWPRAHKVSSARTAARPTRAGPANAKLAANGTRWSRKAPKGQARSSARKGRLFAIEPLKARPQEAPRLAVGHRRIRSRHRRRPGARLGAAARRRSRHRQVDAAARSRGRLRAQPPPRRLYFRRRSGGAGAAARRPARACRCRRRGRGRNLGRGHRRDAVAGRDAAASGHQFDPDHVDADRRSGARHRDPGARLGRRIDPLRQAHRAPP